MLLPSLLGPTPIALNCHLGSFGRVKQKWADKCLENKFSIKLYHPINGSVWMESLRCVLFPLKTQNFETFTVHIPKPDGENIHHLKYSRQA